MGRPSRRDVLASVAVGVASSPGVPTRSTESVATSGDDWSMYQHDAGNTGYAPAATPPEAPELAWAVGLGDGRSVPPAVADGTVYVPAASEGLYAVDASSGTERWRVLADGPGTLETSPAVTDGTIYVGGSDHIVHAVDAESGERQWSKEMEDDLSASSPTVVDGTLYVARDDGTLFALDAGTGAERWVTEVTDDRARGPPAVDDGTVYHAADEGVVALDAENGTRRWTADRSPASPAVADGDRVFVTGYDGFAALDAATGEPQWGESITGISIAPPVVVRDSVLFRGAGYVSRHAAADGTVEWTYREDQRDNEQSMTDWDLRLSSDVVVAGRVAYVLSANGILYAVDVATGADAGTTTLDGSRFSSPSVAGGSMYLSDDDGTLYALRDDGGGRPADGGGTAPTPTAGAPADVHDWLGPWSPLLGLLLGVPVVGALVLAVLVAVTDRHGEEPTSADAGEET